LNKFNLKRLSFKKPCMKIVCCSWHARVQRVFYDLDVRFRRWCVNVCLWHNKFFKSMLMMIRLCNLKIVIKNIVGQYILSINSWFEDIKVNLKTFLNCFDFLIGGVKIVKPNIATTHSLSYIRKQILVLKGRKRFYVKKRSPHGIMVTRYPN
jgi:hypothetical protein